MLVALSPGKEARITLADGTELVARRRTGANAASGYPVVTAEQIAMCTGKPGGEGCLVASEEGGVSRLRITTPLAAATVVAQDDVELSAKGPLARRIRWDSCARSSRARRSRSSSVAAHRSRTLAPSSSEKAG